MKHQGPTRTRIPFALWIVVSAALHVAFVFALLTRAQVDRSFAALEPSVWVESVAPPPAPPPPPPPAPTVQPARDKPARTAAARTSVATSTPSAVEPQANANSGEAAELTSDTGSFAVGGDGTTGTGTGEGSAGDGQDVGGGEPAAAEKERKPGAAQLSMWLVPTALARMALVRPTLSLLMSVPGYRDVLRGSGIRPFDDLERLRIQLSGLAAEQLVVAGVHLRGEQALLDTATRVAAMRNREPIWSGDSDLRATSWVDGTGIDRGLAVHEGAFVIAAREGLPVLLGAQAAGKKVASMSQMRERAVMLLTIEDAARYVPGLSACEAQALRLSVAASNNGYRMALTVHYKAASFANRAESCLRGLQADDTAMPRLFDWLAQARSAQGSFSTSLQVEVDSDDVQQLLGELAWLLRRA